MSSNATLTVQLLRSHPATHDPELCKNPIHLYLTASGLSFIIGVLHSSTQRGKQNMPRTTEVITFSIPPEMAEQVRQVVREEGRTMSEFLREAIRLYMEEVEWLRRERRKRAEARRNEQLEAEGGRTDE